MRQCKCSLCNNNFFYLKIDTLNLRNNRLLKIFSINNIEINKVLTNQNLKQVCHYCFYKYLNNPKILLFEYEMQII